MRRSIVAISLLSLLTDFGCSASKDGGPPCAPDGSEPALTWDAPAHDDGTPVDGVAGYNIYYEAAQGTYRVLIFSGTSTSCSSSALKAVLPGPGTYDFVVTARDAAGNESAYSNEISKTF